MDEAEFQSQFRASGPVTMQAVFARALMPDRDELAEAAAQRAAEGSRAEERELRRMLNAQAGDPLGQLTRAETAAAAPRDEVRDRESKLDIARGRLHRAAEAVVDFRTAADEVMTSSARRSSPHDLLSPAREALAAQRVEHMLAERSARPVEAARRERRPVQQATHGQAAPETPDVGGRGSASDPVC